MFSLIQEQLGQATLWFIGRCIGVGKCLGKSGRNILGVRIGFVGRCFGYQINYSLPFQQQVYMSQEVKRA